MRRIRRQSARAVVALVVLSVAASCAAESAGSDTTQPVAATPSTSPPAPTEAPTTAPPEPTAAVPTMPPVTAPPATEPLPPMPNVLCMNLQDAQDYIQTLGIFFSRSEDATGAGRSQLIDSNWLVVDQYPAPGTPFDELDATLYVIKYGETPNPC